MAFSKVSGSKVFRMPLGNRWLVNVLLDEVDNTGSSADIGGIAGISSIEAVLGAVSAEDAVNVQVRKNSLTDSATEDDPGQIFIKTSAGTHDVFVTLLCK